MKRLLLTAVLLAPAGAAAQISMGTVSGEIRTREGQPAVGVRVSAMAVPEAGVPANSGTALVSIGMTDNQGRYRLENVLPGRYYITAGFVDAPTYYPGVPAVSGATVVSVLSSTPVTGINFAVANSVGVTVSGRVRSSTGTSGVGGQPVALVGGAPPIQQTTTAADGSFQFLRVRPGRYQLTLAFPAGGKTNQPPPLVVGDHGAQALGHVVGAVHAFEHAAQRLDRARDVGLLALEPAQPGRGVGHDRGERLADLVREGRGQRADRREVGIATN